MQPTTKTDTPLPLAPPVPEVASTRPAPLDRLISGIDLLDFGAGGLLPNKIYLVRGGRGVGKTLLGLQYLTRGLELQEPGVLITDQKPANILAQAHGIGFAIDESVRRGQLAILNPSNRYFQLVESPADVMAIMEELFDYIRKIGARRLVIDPVYTLINTTYSAHFALSITQSLLNALEDLPVTTLLIAGEDQAPELNPILRQLEQNAFGIIALLHDASTGGRLMRLSKLCYASNETLSAHYRILNGRGLINYRGEGEQVVDVTKPWEVAAETARTVLILGAAPSTIRRVRDAIGNDYELRAEADLKAGVERAKREKPALILVTPSRSVSAVAAILDLAQHADSPIAFLSPAANRQADEVLYLRAGADDFITEPFQPAELHGRVDALVQRSGRRLNLTNRGPNKPEEVSSLMHAGHSAPSPKGPALEVDGDKISFAPELEERLQRNVETVSKFDQPYAVYWIKAHADKNNLNRSLAQLCRQEDVVCHNRGGEFVAILTGADENGVKGFETRLHEKLGAQFESVRHGYMLHAPARV
jgi:KaiC/GvpD/RAD55 family RecA-like ATPase/DNA-binding response OmpR family regulator